MFYHNGILPNGGGFHRSTAIEEFKYNEDGSIPFIPFTTEGVEPIGTLDPYRRVEAETMNSSWGIKLDRAAGREHRATSIHNGDWIKLRCVDFADRDPKTLSLAPLNLKHPGRVEFYLDSISESPIASVFVSGNAPMGFDAPLAKPISGVHDVYILFRGGDEELFDLDWWMIK